MILITRILAQLHISKQVSNPSMSPEVVHELEIPRDGRKTTHKRNKPGASRYHSKRHSIEPFAGAYSTPPVSRNPEPAERGSIIRGASYIQPCLAYIIPAYLKRLVPSRRSDFAPGVPNQLQVPSGKKIRW